MASSVAGFLKLEEPFMNKTWTLAFCLWLCVACAVASEGQMPSGAIVFSEPGFPVADSTASPAQIPSLLRGSQTASAEQLPALLRSPDTHVLVLPYGSAFPEVAWAGIE